MLGMNAGPALVSGVLAYGIEAIRRKEFFSKYTLVNAVEIFASTWLSQGALAYVPDMGVVGFLGASATSSVIAGALYTMARLYIQGETDNKMKNFGYGFGLSLAGDWSSTAVFSVIGSTKLNIGTVEVNVGAGNNLRADLPPSNVNNPPGSATPLNAPQMSSSGAYANPCWWR